MSDHGSAYIYGSIFRYLGKRSPLDKRAARRFWKDSFEFDFSPDDMECDSDLKKFGLCRRGPEGIEYPDMDGRYDNE